MAAYLVILVILMTVIMILVLFFNIIYPAAILMKVKIKVDIIVL